MPVSPIRSATVPEYVTVRSRVNDTPVRHTCDHGVRVARSGCASHRQLLPDLRLDHRVRAAALCGPARQGLPRAAVCPVRCGRAGRLVATGAPGRRTGPPAARPDPRGLRTSGNAVAASLPAGRYENDGGTTGYSPARRAPV